MTEKHTKNLFIHNFILSVLTIFINKLINFNIDLIMINLFLQTTINPISIQHVNYISLLACGIAIDIFHKNPVGLSILLYSTFNIYISIITKNISKKLHNLILLYHFLIIFSISYIITLIVFKLTEHFHHVSFTSYILENLIISIAMYAIKKRNKKQI